MPAATATPKEKADTWREDSESSTELLVSQEETGGVSKLNN